MIGKMLTLFGILLVATGTIWSVWSVLQTNSNHVGTVDWYNNQGRDFATQKKQVIQGLILIIVGSLLQMVGLFL